MQALLNRLKEPSTYAGFGVILGMIGVSQDPGLVQSVSMILAGAAGVISFFIPEKFRG